MRAIAFRKVLLCSLAAALVAPLVTVPAPAEAITPSTVSHLALASKTSTSIALKWVNSTSRTDAAAVVRYSRGKIAPATRTSGSALATVRKPGHVVTKTGLLAGQYYAFSVFATDLHGHYSRPARIVIATYPASWAFDGKWSGTAKDPDGYHEPVTFTVSRGSVVKFQGWIYGFCSNGSLDDVYLSGPAPIKSGKVARAESIEPVKGYRATSSMTGFFHGRTANGTIGYVFTGCAESPWTWTASRS